MPDRRREEQWASDMIAATLGMTVRQHDDGSRPGMHDLDIVRPGRPPAAVEVTAAADRYSIQLWKLINGSDERWMAPALHGGWMVSLEPNARAKRIRSELPALLADAEEHGVTLLERNRRRDPDLLTARATELGIVYAWQGATAHPGSIYLTIEQPPERTGGIVSDTADCVSPWIAAFLKEPAQADVLAKLARSGTDERHAFLILPGFSTAPFEVVDLLWREDGPVPMVRPALPPEVTHVWLVATWRIGSGLRWSPESGWGRFSKQAKERQG